MIYISQKNKNKKIFILLEYIYSICCVYIVREIKVKFEPIS